MVNPPPITRENFLQAELTKCFFEEPEDIFGCWARKIVNIDNIVMDYLKDKLRKSETARDNQCNGFKSAGCCRYSDIVANMRNWLGSTGAVHCNCNEGTPS